MNVELSCVFLSHSKVNHEGLGVTESSPLSWVLFRVRLSDVKGFGEFLVILPETFIH